MKSVKKIKKKRQIALIKKLNKRYPTGWWLAGGWAHEIITGIPAFHGDIDIYTAEEISARKIDIHYIRKENNSFIEETRHGRFFFKSDSFEEKARNFFGEEIRTVSPEFLLALALGSPNWRPKNESDAEKIRRFADRQKMKDIVRYESL